MRMEDWDKMKHHTETPARPMPTFVSQRQFRFIVTYAEERGENPQRYFGAQQILVHPDALDWYLNESAWGRMRTHFWMLDA